MFLNPFLDSLFSLSEDLLFLSLFPTLPHLAFSRTLTARRYNDGASHSVHPFGNTSEPNPCDQNRIDKQQAPTPHSSSAFCGLLSLTEKIRVPCCTVCLLKCPLGTTSRHPRATRSHQRDSDRHLADIPLRASEGQLWLIPPAAFPVHEGTWLLLLISSVNPTWARSAL